MSGSPSQSNQQGDTRGEKGDDRWVRPRGMRDGRVGDDISDITPSGRSSCSSFLYKEATCLPTANQQLLFGSSSFRQSFTAHFSLSFTNLPWGRREYRPLHVITRFSRTPPPSTVIYDHTVLSHPSALGMPPWDRISTFFFLSLLVPFSTILLSSATLVFQSPLSLYTNVSSISDPLKTGQFHSLSRHVSPELCQPASSPRPLYESPGLQLHFAQAPFT